MPRTAQSNTYVQLGLAANTKRAYERDLKRFVKWGGHIPASPQLVAKYLAENASALKASTLTRHLASIARAHTEKRLPSPTSDQLVRATLRGIQRVHGTAQRQARPLTRDLLRRIVTRKADATSVVELRDRALLLIGYAGAFRRSELTAIVGADLEFSADGVVITLRASKTDSLRKGRKVPIPFTRTRDCPVKALQTWLRQSPADAASPVFRSIDRDGNLRSRHMNAGSVGLILRRSLKQAGLDPNGYSAHSLRAGFVSDAARSGAPTWAIQRQTGHRSEATVHRYIRELGDFERNAVAALWSKT